MLISPMATKSEVAGLKAYPVEANPAVNKIRWETMDLGRC
jgi:hypothetical protein